MLFLCFVGWVLVLWLGCLAWVYRQESKESNELASYYASLLATAENERDAYRDRYQASWEAHERNKAIMDKMIGDS